ncbi:MAG: penicillin-binding protein 2 [Flavobacteriales bacterium]|nr:penicillin-binding protein 2 [Flavobacteriales bacterium]
MATNNRATVIKIAILLFAFVLIAKLFYLQIISDKYVEKSANISIRVITDYPDRGLIIDRNGEVIVFNEDAHDLVIHFPFDTSKIDMSSLAHLLKLSRDEVSQKFRSLKSYNGKAIFIKNLEAADFARIQEGLHSFPQFALETRSDRKYKHNVAAHTLGYVAEISRTELENDKEEYYDIGEYIGKSGIEKYYETRLRGVKGKQYFLRNNAGYIKDIYKNGEFDSKSKVADAMHVSLDVLLQEYGEKLMEGKTGSIVAIEPSTGEILAMVSTPGYKPDMFAIKNLGKNYAALAADPNKPLINRAITSQYPPGSTFKTVMALIGLQEGVITPETRFTCAGGFHVGRLTVRCHPHFGSPDLRFSIQTSCNAYYCNVFREILHQDRFANIEEGYNNWAGYLDRFGLGHTLGCDISGEKGGNVPTAEYFHRYHGKNKWNYVRIVSLAIGQGELTLTPLQIANIATIIANRGYYYTPHVYTGEGINSAFTEKHLTRVDAQHFAPVIEGMRGVMLAGTGAGVQIPGIEICGKTGTAQNPHGENHSIFMAFAPMNNPKIAIATIVENAGYGATWAAPISTLMIEKYINRDSISQRPDLEKRVMRPLHPQAASESSHDE